MGEDTTEALEQAAGQRDGDVTGRGRPQQGAGAAEPPGLLLAEQDVDDALALLDGADAGLSSLAPAQGALLLPEDRGPGDALALLDGASEDYARLLRESARAPDAVPEGAALDLAQAGERLRESARALPASGLLEGDEVDAALGALEALEAEAPAWPAADASDTWRSQRPERLHAGAIGEQRAHEEEDAQDEAVDPLDTWYVAPEGTPQGPLTLQVLRERWEAGAVGPDTPCWSGGLARWVPLSRVLKLAGALAPPVPRLSLEQVAASLRAPAAPAFQPLAGGALRSLLAEEETRSRSEAFARSEALARMQEARAAALTAYVPPPTPTPGPAPERRAGSGILVPALLGSAMTALALTCALLGFSLLRAREGTAAQTQGPLAAALAPPQAEGRGEGGTAALQAGGGSQAAPSGREQPSRSAAGTGAGAGASRSAAAAKASAATQAKRAEAGAAPARAAGAHTAAAKRAEAGSAQARSTGAEAAQARVAGADTVRASGAAADTVQARGTGVDTARARGADAARPESAAASAAQAGNRKALAAAVPAGDEEASSDEASGEVAFDEEEAPAAEEQKPRAPLGPDEEFERALSAEEPPVADGEEGAAAQSDATPRAAEAKAAPAPAPAIYVPPAPGAGAALRESLAQADVLETVLAHKAEVVACATAHKPAQLEPATRLVLRFGVLPAGTVTDVATETEELQGSALARCIESAVAGWRFPQHRLQGPAIRFPFTL